jgi:hypothetical protein
MIKIKKGTRDTRISKCCLPLLTTLLLPCCAIICRFGGGRQSAIDGLNCKTNTARYFMVLLDKLPGAANKSSLKMKILKNNNNF